MLWHPSVSILKDTKNKGRRVIANTDDLIIN